ncbi:MAG: flavin reductase family protein [Bauldia sp.]
MHYQPEKNDHGLPHSPFLALVAPRPIGWISTISPAGVVNLAPYSFFNAVSSRPPMVMFASSAPKDSQGNAEASGEFVANLATYDLREAVVETSRPIGAHLSEPETIGLAMTASRYVKTPRVARAHAALECRYLKTVELHDHAGKRVSSSVVFGEVVGVFIDDALIVEGLVDLSQARPLARLGYKDYATLAEIFAMAVHG